MPSARRVKVLAIALTIAVCTILYLSFKQPLTSMPCIQNDSSSQDFYTRTVAALDKKEISDQEVAQKLQQAKDAAKVQELVGVTSPQRPIAANIEDQNPVQVKAPVHSEEGDRDGLATEVIRESAKSVAGRKTMKGGEHRDMHSGKGAAMVSNREKGKTTSQKEGKEEKVESKEEHEVEMELNSILKKGPIIIFSKSYCPYSAKAKRILLEKYTIVPAPYVVELDTHPLGSRLQAALEKSTGRRTVPNVLISGRSIGGGDDIEALDNEGGLIEKVKGMAGKRIMEAKLTEEK